MRFCARTRKPPQGSNALNKADYSERVDQALERLPPAVRNAFFKQVRFLEQNPRHPSLRAKKYDESHNLWQARVNWDWRFYFLIRDDIYYIVDIIPAPEITAYPCGRFLACSMAIWFMCDSARAPLAPSMAFTAISCTCCLASASCFSSAAI